MIRFVLAVLTVTWMQAQSAQAIQMASPQSNKMVKTCLVQDDKLADATCQAFVLGVTDSTAFYGAAQQLDPPFCTPRKTALNEVVAVYRDYLKNHHNLKQFSAAALVVAALKAAYPCK